MLAVLVLGACLVLAKTFDGEEVWETVSKNGVTVMIGTPNGFIGYLAHEAFKPEYVKSVRLIWMGGATIPPQLVLQLRELPFDGDGKRAVVQVYGMTETGGITMMTRTDDSEADAATSIGFLLPNFTIRLVCPETLTDVPDGESGELWIKSPYLLHGYRNVTDDVLRQSFTDGWFRTGDLITRHPSGRYTFEGRLK